LTAVAQPARRSLDPWTRAFLGLADSMGRGTLAIVLPGGALHRFTGLQRGPAAELHLHDLAAARAFLTGGAVKFAEAYVDGHWSTPDLPSLIELAVANEDALDSAWNGRWLGRVLGRIRHLLRANTKAGSRRNIRFHYDRGNAFYKLWLDPGMTYSSALYTAPGMTLEAAQDAKLDRVADLLELTPGMSVLELGCGWGGMAEHLTRRHGAVMTGVTLSTEQLAWAQRRLRDTAADMRLQDYRDVTGTFDRIVSIEMVEAVGEANWPRYFATLRDRLKPGGTAVVQSITIADARFDRYRQGADFIQKHIFPGGMLPSPSVLRDQAARAGLRVAHMEPFGLSYALTVAEWRRRFLDAWPEIAALGYDARFRSLWDYYLAYCEAGFRAGTIDVSLWTFQKPPAAGQSS
jgi:cyclopropane-fatty-acyl-phospholipid synthase